MMQKMTNPLAWCISHGDTWAAWLSSVQGHDQVDDRVSNIGCVTSDIRFSLFREQNKLNPLGQINEKSRNQKANKWKCYEWLAETNRSAIFTLPSWLLK